MLSSLSSTMGRSVAILMSGVITEWVRHTRPVELQQIGLSHPRVKQVLDIQHNTAPNRERLLVAEGLWAQRLVLAAGTSVRTFLWCPELAYSDEARQRADELAARAEQAYRVSPKTLERVSERGQPDGLLSVARLPAHDPDTLRFGPSALVLVADAVEIPGNLGTLIRTLDAVRADCLVLTNRRTRLTHPKVFRGSQGTVLTVPSVEFEQPAQGIEWLRSAGFRVLLADTDDAVHYRRGEYPGPGAPGGGGGGGGPGRPGPPAPAGPPPPAGGGGPGARRARRRVSSAVAPRVPRARRRH